MRNEPESRSAPSAKVKQPLQVLLIEDSADDAELMVRALQIDDFDLVATQVDSEATLRAAFERQSWDLILCDYNLPGFGGASALGVARHCAGAIPIVIVSGAIGEEMAAELVRLGADDVVRKENMRARLALAVRRELAAAEVRQSEQRLHTELLEQSVELRREIGERRVLEASLRESEEGFRQLFQSNPAPMWVWDVADQSILEINDAAIRAYGYCRDDFLKMRICDIVFRDDFQEKLMSRLDEKFIHVEGIRHRLADGRVIETETYSHQFEYRGRQARQSLCLDISARRLTEAELRQSQKMEAVGQLTGGLAHDFNNLIGIVIGNLDMLMERLAPESLDEMELVDAAIDAAVRGAELTKQLLAFSRQQALSPKIIDLASVLRQTSQLLRRTLGEAITIDMRVADGIWPVLVDCAQLESAILNLAINARDAMREGGRLTIEVGNGALDGAVPDLGPMRAQEPHVVISIADTGTGIPPEFLQQVFDPFFTTKGSGGTGLGLSMVYGFVKQSGGHTSITSEPGLGTTVRIYLPRAVAAWAQAPTQELRTAATAAGTNEIVLVVEDNDGMRGIVVRQLQSLGYRTIQARDGAAGLAFLRGGTAVDLLFTDIIMPGGMDGWALAKAAGELRPGLKVLLTSGFNSAAASPLPPERMAIDLLNKPYRKDDLALRIRAALDRTTITDQEMDPSWLP
jgi:two-component system, cell cycle sensor histidine kinase and response regulator CckA